MKTKEDILRELHTFPEILGNKDLVRVGVVSSEASLYDAMKTGDFPPSYRLAHLRYYKRDEVIAWFSKKSERMLVGSGPAFAYRKLIKDALVAKQMNIDYLLKINNDKFLVSQVRCLLAGAFFPTEEVLMWACAILDLSAALVYKQMRIDMDKYHNDRIIAKYPILEGSLH